MDFKQLEDKIKSAYEEGTTIDEAEKLAAEFLYAQMSVAKLLQAADLDARMRKTGVKAIKAAIYLSEVQKADKKPSDVLLEQTVNTNELVTGEQNAYDEAEVNKEALERQYNIFRESHIYFRGISKGRFE
jgi:hypothetical protein